MLEKVVIFGELADLVMAKQKLRQLEISHLGRDGVGGKSGIGILTSFLEEANALEA